MPIKSPQPPAPHASLVALVENAPDFIMLVNEDHEIAYINRGVASIVLSEVIGQKVQGYVGPSDRQRVTDAIQGVFDTHEPTSYETTGPGNLPGEVRYYLTRVGWVPGADGDLVSLVATDITDRRRLEGQLWEERRALDALDRVSRALSEEGGFEQMLRRCLSEMLSIFSASRVWLISPCDPKALEFRVEMEVTVPEWPGAAKLGVPIPASDYTANIFSAVLESSGAYAPDPTHDDALDPEFLRAFHIESQLVVCVRPRAGQPWCLGLHHCDAPVSYTWQAPLLEAIAQRLADSLSGWDILSALQESEARFRTVVDHAAEAITILDVSTMRFLDTNGKAEALFGYSNAELRNMGPAETSPEFQPGGEPSWQLGLKKVSEALEGGEPTFEWTHKNKQGELIPCEVRLVLLPSKDKRLVRGSVTDIRGRKAVQAERKQLQAQLIQAQKMEAVGQLTGGVAHDFNNLLAVIQGNLELLGLSVDLEPEVQRLLDAADAATTRAAMLTRRLLAFSRTQVLQPRRLDLMELIQGMRGMLGSALGETIECVVEQEPHLWPCKVDAAQLENAILNLAINARDAMPDGGRLTLATSNATVGRDAARAHTGVEPGEYLRVAMTDSGTGMDAVTLARACEPFFSTKGPGHGSGLGLSMVFGFAQQSGGHMQLDSELGGGTTVAIYLPRCVDAARPSSPELAQSADVLLGMGQRVLVVEDEPAVRELSVGMLLYLGYRPVAVASGPEALAVLAGGQPFEVLFTDVVLPGGIHGAELVERARALRPGLPALLTSGYAPSELVGRHLVDSAVELLQKPFTRDQLARGIAGALGRGAAVEPAVPTDSATPA